MNILTVENISKSYGMKTLFNNISLGIQEGERIGIIGVNGTGKSTLLKVLAGIVPPDGGTVTIGNRMRVEFLPQNPVFEEAGTVLDQIFAGDSPLMQLVKNMNKQLSGLAAIQEMKSYSKNWPT